MAAELAVRYEGELEQMTGHLGQMYEELMLLYGVGDDVAATLEPNTIADQALDRIVDLMDAEVGLVVHVTEPDQPLELVGSARVPDGAALLIHWATWQAVRRDRAMILGAELLAEAPANSGVTSLLSCPLRARGRCIGALHLVNKKVDGGFSTVDQGLLQAVATQLGTAIENARLFEAEQEYAARVSAALDALQSTYDETLKALSSALDLRDNETEGHAQRVTRITARIAQEMGYADDVLVEIVRGALLHDMGKIGIPDGILLKPDRLTDDEWTIMRTHAELGYQMIRNIRFLAGSAPIVRHHHERYDGRGYPAGLVGDDIPIGARIFAVADTFDAMTSDRPYRKALTYEASRDEILRCSGSQFDPKVVDSFCQIEADVWVAVRAEVERDIESRRQQAAN